MIHKHSYLHINTRYLMVLCLLLLSSTNSFSYQRIASINLCTDTLLYALVGTKNVVSFSYLAQQQAYFPAVNAVKNIPTNHALAEEIIPLKPDIVLASTYSSIQSIFFLKQLGMNVQQIDIPFDLAGIEQTILTTGDILHLSQRAHAIVDDMQQRKQRVIQQVKNKSRPRIISLAPNGYTHGKNSMRGDLMEMAGYENLAATVGIEGTGFISLEQILHYQPDFIIIDSEDEGQYSLAQRFLTHPALRHALPHSQYIQVPSNLWSCASPYMIDALEILANAHP